MTKFTAKDKLSAVQRYLEGKESYRAIATSIGTDHSVVRSWVKQYEHHGEAAFIKSYTSYSAQFKRHTSLHEGSWDVSPVRMKKYRSYKGKVGKTAHELEKYRLL
jgi:transposase